MALKLIGQNSLQGHGKTMQVMKYKDYLYVGNMVPGIGTIIVDVTNPSLPLVCGEMPAYKNALCSKVQIVDDLMIINYECRTGKPAERLGFSIYSLQDPKNPREIAYYHVGGQGVHRTWYSGEEPYIFVTAVPEGFSDRMLLIVDIKDPAHPQEVGRWWYPGLWTAGGEKPDQPQGLKYKLHHAMVHKDRAYLGMWDAGMYILDISQISNPQVAGSINWGPERGGHTHTGLPLPRRNLLVVTDEAKGLPGEESLKAVRILDIKDDKNPRVLSEFYVENEDYGRYGPRFGPHNLHENRPGSWQSDEIIFVTWFGGGLRVVDISDPCRPKEMDRLIPPPVAGMPPTQVNDVFVGQNGLLYLTDRAGSGIMIAEFTG
ncbi:hypothetical protein DesLBE_1317 [Desulfitobacterium sp. LBE]|uniref:LVIVD repeat protein n=3 Tax=Desulfitobacterium hafniense TaxID=49338 RepID=Q24YX6_DESHY|nr:MULTISPECIES: hypothetical protein [Desulfitobacterium]ACL20099.1 LVIVD repeat protein [Desulfitobacterium hafniense DCB-2]KTE90341.1 hypothetical protein AT727_07030 [Desulfitobacterium hafniense]TWH57059.1 hypothetical protein DesLBE_1317 [Desulfitobacterium sp. LBE]BAE82766.1 hypothetical protein DSY0977 [Desulfitobacterium hafniense Y51]